MRDKKSQEQEVFIRYVLCSGSRYKICSFNAVAFANSGTKSWDTSVCGAINGKFMKDCYSANTNNIVLSQGVYNEINNSVRSDFQMGCLKSELLLNILKISESGSFGRNSFNVVEDIHDLYAIDTAIKMSVPTVAADYHLAANCKYYGISYYFRLSKEHILFMEKEGKRALVSRFVKKVNNLIDEAKREKREL